MKDAKTLACINLFAILGALPYLCELDPQSAKLIEGQALSIGFAVKDGPSATLYIGGGRCRMAPPDVLFSLMILRYGITLTVFR